MKTLLSVEINEAGYFEKKPIIKGIQFSIKFGELVGLIGSNGAGKSTTIKGILGILPYFLYSNSFSSCITDMGTINVLSSDDLCFISANKNHLLGIKTSFFLSSRSN